MKGVIIISLFMIAVLCAILFLALHDAGGKNTCTTPLKECVLPCTKQGFWDKTACTFSCSIKNFSCLINLK